MSEFTESGAFIAGVLFGGVIAVAVLRVVVGNLKGRDDSERE